MMHWLAHKLGIQLGTVETFQVGGHWYIGHECATCRKVSHPTHMDLCSTCREIEAGTR